MAERSRDHNSEQDLFHRIVRCEASGRRRSESDAAHVVGRKVVKSVFSHFRGRLMDITVGCQLSYTLDQLTGFIFQIEVAKAEGQYVTSESLVIPGGPTNSSYAAYTDINTATGKIRTVIGPGPVDIYSEATVNLDKNGIDPSRMSGWQMM